MLKNFTLRGVTYALQKVEAIKTDSMRSELEVMHAFRDEAIRKGRKWSYCHMDNVSFKEAFDSAKPGSSLILWGFGNHPAHKQAEYFNLAKSSLKDVQVIMMTDCPSIVTSHIIDPEKDYESFGAEDEYGQIGMNMCERDMMEKVASALVKASVCDDYACDLVSHEMSKVVKKYDGVTMTFKVGHQWVEGTLQDGHALMADGSLRLYLKVSNCVYLEDRTPSGIRGMTCSFKELGKTVLLRSSQKDYYSPLRVSTAFSALKEILGSKGTVILKGHEPVQYTHWEVSPNGVVFLYEDDCTLDKFTLRENEFDRILKVYKTPSIR